MSDEGGTEGAGDEDDERNTTAVNYAPEMVLVVFRWAGVETPC